MKDYQIAGRADIQLHVVRTTRVHSMRVAISGAHYRTPRCHRVVAGGW